MAKKKAKLRTEFNKSIRRTHKQKSNKMIYAVAGGLAIIVLIFILVSTGGDSTPPNKEKLILETTEYLNKNTSITDILALPKENKAVVSYDLSLVDENQKNLDFKEMIRYAAIRLSNEIKNEDVQILLKEDKKKKKPYLVVAKNGKIINEKLLDQ